MSVDAGEGVEPNVPTGDVAFAGEPEGSGVSTGAGVAIVAGGAVVAGVAVVAGMPGSFGEEAGSPGDADALVDAFDRLIAADPATVDAALGSMSPRELSDLARDWQAWAHPGRRAPPGDWNVWVMMAGRGFGKTRTGAEWVNDLARRDGSLRIALVGASLVDARSVMVEGSSGVLARADAAGVSLRWVRSEGRMTWKSGARAQLFSGATPDLLRGPEHHYAWCDELAKWPRADEAWSNLQLGLRLGARPRALVTTTPRPMPLLRRIVGEPGTVLTRGRTAANPYLHARVRAEFARAFGGTRMGRQELDGELIVDAEGALWPRAMIEGCRVGADAVPALVRTVIGVDPPAGSGRQADACGIVAVGLAANGCGYVLEDASVQGARPEGWAAAVVAAYRRWNAVRVIAEKNQGGDMVESVLRAVEGGLPLRLVHASQGKVARAEPVAALYERGRVFHAGAFPALEDEMAGMTANGGYVGQGQGSRRSPDRADALVWGVTELMLARGGGTPRIRGL